MKLVCVCVCGVGIGQSSDIDTDSIVTQFLLKIESVLTQSQLSHSGPAQCWLSQKLPRVDPPVRGSGFTAYPRLNHRFLKGAAMLAGWICRGWISGVPVDGSGDFLNNRRGFNKGGVNLWFCVRSHLSVFARVCALLSAFWVLWVEGKNSTFGSLSGHFAWKSPTLTMESPLDECFGGSFTPLLYHCRPSGASCEACDLVIPGIATLIA